MSIPGLLAAGADWVEFAALRDAAGITDSVLSKHSGVLEDAQHIEVRKATAKLRLPDGTADRPAPWAIVPMSEKIARRRP